MQYLKELPNGNRVSVDHFKYGIDRHHPKFVQIIATGTIIVYKLAIAQKVANAVVALKYGGQRPRMGNVWNGG